MIIILIRRRIILKSTRRRKEYKSMPILKTQMSKSTSLMNKLINLRNNPYKNLSMNKIIMKLSKLSPHNYRKKIPKKKI